MFERIHSCNIYALFYAINLLNRQHFLATRGMLSRLISRETRANIFSVTGELAHFERKSMDAVSGYNEPRPTETVKLYNVSDKPPISHASFGRKICG